MNDTNIVKTYMNKYNIINRIKNRLQCDISNNIRDVVVIKCDITKTDASNTTTFTIRYKLMENTIINDKRIDYIDYHLVEMCITKWDIDIISKQMFYVNDVIDEHRILLYDKDNIIVEKICSTV